MSETLGPLCQSALGYAERGYEVFPVHGVCGGVCLCPKGPRCEDAGKHPATPRGFYDATSDPDQIREWWRGNPDANIGICTGDGFFVFDVDDLESFGRFLEEHGPLPETLKLLASAAQAFDAAALANAVRTGGRNTRLKHDGWRMTLLKQRFRRLAAIRLADLEGGEHV